MFEEAKEHARVSLGRTVRVTFKLRNILCERRTLMFNVYLRRIIQFIPMKS